MTKRLAHKISDTPAIDDDVLAKIGEVAKKKSVSSEELINTWLRDKL